MTIESTILALISTAVTGGAFAAYGIDADHVAWPGVNFTPPDPDPVGSAVYWIEPVPLRNDPIDVALNFDSSNIPNGLFRVVVNTRPGGGIIKLYELAELVAATFPKGTALADGLFISKEPVVQSLITEDDKLMLPVSMTYTR